MARKSKYFSNDEENKKIWSTALYIRLSQEDGDNGQEKLESNSITSQKNILNEFVMEQTDFKVYDIYIDDGFTGTDFNRPSFTRLLEDMKNKKINCIIVKDLSRLGRNYIEVGNYIEQVFPLFNIRFIAINDNVDSFQNPSSTNTILVPFKNLINDEYSRDTSIKIKSSLNSKKRKGEFVGSFAPYGYIKNKKDKHKLEIDEVAAKWVKKIFYWKVNCGLGNIAICHKLNELGILNPTGHKKIELKQNYNNFGIKDNEYTWTPSTIRNILKNEVYIGNTVQGKRKAKSYKIHKIENVPEEEWVRVENTHEPIIEKELFCKAQELSNKDTRVEKRTNKLSVFAGILKCNECKRAMNKKSSTNKSGKTYEYYICSTYRKKSNKLCTKHTIKVDNLEKAVLYAINYHIEKLINPEEIVKKVENEIKNKPILKNDFENIIIKKKNEMNRISSFKKSLYEDWKNEYITREEYLQYKQEYENDLKKIENNLNNLEKQKEKEYNKKKEKNNFLNNFEKEFKFTELTRNIIQELIEVIYVHECGKITIKFRFAKYINL